MKRVLCTVAALMLATVAFAGSMGDMTPQQAMDKVMNCPVCSAFGADPALGPTMRHNVIETKAGYVDVCVTASEAMVPSLDKAHTECMARCKAIPTMTAEQKGKLCDCCNAMTALMNRKDITWEGGKTETGIVTVASASSPDGVKALHEYAELSQKTTNLLMQAAMQMSKEPQKSKM